MLKRTSLITGMVAVALLGLAAPALADGPFGSVDCAQNPQPSCQVEAGTGGHNGGGGTAGGGNNGGNGTPATAVPCGGLLDPLCSLNGAIQNPAPSPADLARVARSQLRLPSPGIAASPAGDQLVNLPTWLWLSEGWRPVSATASVPGVSVTAVAKPDSVSWSMGDGGTVECAGPGTPYRAGVDPRSASPDCGYVYRRSSAAQPGQEYRVIATIRWTITWSGAGQSGAFPVLTTSTTTTYRVAESQALGNG